MRARLTLSTPILIVTYNIGEMAMLTNVHL
jgi:hypothetical protein